MAAATPARRVFLQFIASVAALHVAALGLYYALGIAGAPIVRQRMFAWAWIGLTVVVVFGGLQRIKRARRAQ